MQSTERDLRQMLGSYLQRNSQSAKDLARKINCDPRSAEGYRAGRYWPQAKHWVGLVAAFGKDITEAVFHPEETAARLEKELAELEQQLAEKRALARDLADLGACPKGLQRQTRSFAPQTKGSALEPADPN